VIPRKSIRLNPFILPSIYESLQQKPRNPRSNFDKMSNEVYYFNYYIVAAFAEFLNNIEKGSYKNLTDEWWEDCGSDYLPMITTGQYDVPTVSNTLLDRVLAEFPTDFLTAAQKEELYYIVKEALEAFNNRYTPLCYCGYSDCDGDCGTQSCGVCIDCCRCDKYW
jgi:hypothetical protein